MFRAYSERKMAKWVCPHCHNNHGYFTSQHHHSECSECHIQTSIILGTLFHGTKLPLTKWFWAIFWISSDKGDISALRLSKLIGATWRSAFRMLQILRKAMDNRDFEYKLSGTVELDDVYIGGKKTDKRDRGADGKVSVIIACGTKDEKAGFIAMQAVESVLNLELLLLSNILMLFKIYYFYYLFVIQHCN